MAGVTPTGFVPKSFDELVTAVNAELRARFGAGFRLTPDTVAANIRDPLLFQIAELWQAMLDVAQSHSRQQAEGVWLDDAVALIGITRKGAVASTVAVTLTGTNGTLIPAGTVFRVVGTVADDFALDAPLTIVGGTAIGTATAVAAGPTQALAGSLTVIVTPVAGLTAVTNPTDAEVGRNVETDIELRARAAESLQIAGGGTLDAIFARLNDLEGVTGCVVLENATASTDPEGRPPHSVEAVLEGGADQDIADELWAAKPAGIELVSTAAVPVVVPVVDTQGITRSVTFSRPEAVAIWVLVEISLDPEQEAPADVAQAVEDAILALGDQQEVGEDVIVQRYLAAAIGVGGIANVEMAIDTASIPSLPGPFTNINILAVQWADFDSTRVSVSVV